MIEVDETRRAWDRNPVRHVFRGIGHAWTVLSMLKDQNE